MRAYLGRRRGAEGPDRPARSISPILDIKMPRMDGMELLDRLRKQSDLPVIFLTSKDDEVDELMGLRMGADDYIKKPFSQRLLIERIRALLRRESLGSARRGATGPAGEVIQRGELMLDPARHLCTWKGQDGRSDGDRVPAAEGAGPASRSRQEPRPADGLPPMASTSMSTTARSTATSSGCARSSKRSMPSSRRSRRSTASATATASADRGEHPHDGGGRPQAAGRPDARAIRSAARPPRPRRALNRPRRRQAPSRPPPRRRAPRASATTPKPFSPTSPRPRPRRPPQHRPCRGGAGARRSPGASWPSTCWRWRSPSAGLLYLDQYRNSLMQQQLESAGDRGRALRRRAGRERRGDRPRRRGAAAARDHPQHGAPPGRVSEDPRPPLRSGRHADRRQLAALGPGGQVEIELLPPPESDTPRSPLITGGSTTGSTRLLPARQAAAASITERAQQRAADYPEVAPGAGRRDRRARCASTAAAGWCSASPCRCSAIARCWARSCSPADGEIDGAVRDVRLDILKVFGVALGGHGAALALSRRHDRAADPPPGRGGRPRAPRPGAPDRRFPISPAAATRSAISPARCAT